MTVRRWMVLTAGVVTLSFVPLAAQAGVGGSPVPPGAAAAGSSTVYCCATWTPGQVGDNKTAITVFNGTSCVAIPDTATEKNACTAKVLKCRGELYTPATGVVERCLAP